MSKLPHAPGSIVILAAGLFCGAVFAQSNIVKSSPPSVINTVPQPIISQSYTDEDMQTMGLTETDISLYKTQRDTIKGQWWGHVSPVEFLMYASEDKQQRDRYAKLYLSSNLPKAVAEKDAMVSMYEMAREVFAEQHGLVLDDVTDDTEKRPALFVDIGCKHCAEPVVELINQSTLKVDVYFTGLPDGEDTQTHQAAMVEWAKALKLKPQQITLNSDNGIYEKLNNKPLVDYHLMTP